MSIGSCDMPILPPTLSHRKLLLLTANNSSPLTAHNRVYVCPSSRVPLVVILAVKAGTVYIHIKHNKTQKSDHARHGRGNKV